MIIIINNNNNNNNDDDDRFVSPQVVCVRLYVSVVAVYQ